MASRHGVTAYLKFGIVLDSEIVLVLDAQEVVRKAGEIVVQRGTNHAWSNRSGKPAVVAIATHDARYIFDRFLLLVCHTRVLY